MARIVKKKATAAGLKSSRQREQKHTFSAIVFINTKSGKAESQMTPLEKMEVLRTGVSKKDLELLKSKTKLDYDHLARVLTVNRATLINKKGVQKFNPTLSEKIIGIADIYSYGYQVFEDSDRFNLWMFKPNKALGGKVPYDLIDNQFGREEVKNIIGRIDSVYILKCHESI